MFPRMKWLLVSMVVWVGCMTPVMTFGGGKSKTEAQHHVLSTHFMPAQLAIEGPWRGPVKDAKIRVYATDAYRTQNRDWRGAFGEALEYANAVLAANFGVRLVADFREWNHHAPGNSLADDLEELRQLDPGDDVLAVIGLTSALSIVSGSFDQLGSANMPGMHMMIRGYADIEERRAFSEAFPDLPAEERENAHEARRRHKMTAVLLHELGHNLGVGHETTNDTLMNASYSEHAASFTSEAHATMQRALDERLGREAPPAGADELSGAQQAAASAPARTKLYVHVSASSVLIDGRPRDAGEQDVLFSTQVARDPDTEVVIEKDAGVPKRRVLEVVQRAGAAGLKNFTTK